MNAPKMLLLCVTGFLICGAVFHGGFWVPISSGSRLVANARPNENTGPDMTHSGKAERVLYEDAHLQLLEVAYLPGSKVNDTESKAAITIFDAAMPTMNGFNVTGEGYARPPAGLEYPICSSAGPEAAHLVVNNDKFPLHVYRVVYKRVDGTEFASHWKSWYPWMLDPLKPVKDLDPGSNLGPLFSKDYPYPIAMDSYKAAPNNHYLRFEDAHVRFLEVVMRSGERENLHGHPYPSVFEQDTWSLGPPVPFSPEDTGPGTPGLGHRGVIGDHKWDPKSSLNGQDGMQSPPPRGLQGPVCITAGPQAPHAATNGGNVPIHFYRLELKRIDGVGIKTKWAEWYPWLAAVQSNKH